MAVQEVFRGLGTWSIQLRPDLPAEIHNILDTHRYGRIVIDPARDNPALIGDALLTSARYVGGLSSTSDADEQGTTIGGYGMAWWLGDADKKAATVYESQVAFSGSTFQAAVAALLPPSLTAGTITAPSGGGSYSGKHQWQSPREAIDYVCDLFDCAWRVNGDATLDAGPVASLFVDTPTAAIVARTEGGDQSLRGLRGAAKLDRDMDDFSTRVVTLAEGQGSTVRVGTADIAPGLNPFKDPQGNPVQWVRMVSESNTSLTNANARAQLQLNRFTSPRNALNLTTDTHDIRGDVAAGDQVWVYDPEAGLEDLSNEVPFRGDLIYPVKLQVTQLTWGVLPGMGVYFRDTDGGWWDLSDYVVWENDSATQVVVGGYNRSLTDSASEPIGSRVVADNSVPAVPTLNLPWTTGVYQSASGLSRAKIVAAWFQPLNTDGSAIVDGSMYEIQYRTPAGSGDWATQVVGFDQTQASLLDLTPATSYGVRVRAVDTANPPNFGDWSAEQSVTTAGDTIPPATPAAPTVAGNPVSIQVKHTLGAATGGTYNLDPDLNHLEVHASAVGSGFTPDASTKVGELAATQGMMGSTVPAIGTFTVANTGALWVKVVAVDDSGNRSLASAATSASATLIDSAHISDVVASLITTGNMTAVLALVGAIQTASSGARWRADSTGWKTYRPSGTLALWNDSSTGDLIGYQTNGTTPTLRIEASTGNFYLYAANGTTPLLKLTASAGTIEMNGKLTAGDGVGVGRTIVVDPGSSSPVVDFYPTSATSRIQLRARPDTTPAGSGVPAFSINVLDTGGSLAGGQYMSWSTGAQMAYRSGTSSAGAAVNVSTPQGAVLGVMNSSAVFESAYIASGAGDLSLYSKAGRSVSIAGPASGVQVELTSSSALIGAPNNNYFQATPSGSSVVSNGTVKSFVLDHPQPGKEDRYLVHCAVEAPTAGIVYNGVVEAKDGLASVELPDYFESLAEEDGRSIQLTPYVCVHESMRPMIPQAAPTEIFNGRFDIITSAPDGAKIAWQVTATRKGAPFDVEPRRADVQVQGDGPYRYIVPPAA